MMLTTPRERSQLGRYSMTSANPSTAVVVENSSSRSTFGLRARIFRRVESATGGGGGGGGALGSDAIRSVGAPTPVEPDGPRLLHHRIRVERRRGLDFRSLDQI